MHKQLLLILFFIGVSVSLFAQDVTSEDTTSNWKRSFRAGINLNQASFSDNWKGGGVNSIAIGTLLNAKANYESEKVTFVNELDLLYGIMKNKDQTPRKTTDRIFFDSKFGYKFTPLWSAFVSVNFLSQFDLGYNYTENQGVEQRILISKFFSPAYLTSSVGLEYKPVEYFWMRFGLGTFRQTFVGDPYIYRNDPKNYGVEIGKKVRHEVAMQYVADFDKDIAKNIHLKARFSAFANYETLDAIDTRLDLIMTAKVNRFINVNLTAVALYDQDMDYEIQLSQALALGVLFNFSEFPK